MTEKYQEPLGGANIWHVLVTLLTPSTLVLPPLWWGPPGFGKTTMIKQAVRALREKYGWTAEQHPLETMIAAQCDPTDFRGLPYATPDGVRYQPPEEAIRLARAGRGWLFLDEIGNATPAVQGALLRTVVERVMGTLDLPDPEVRICGAANPPEEAAGGWEQAAAMGNRWTHLLTSYADLRASNADWIAWKRHGVSKASDLPIIDPERWEREVQNVTALVTRYIERNPDAMTEDRSEWTGRFPLAFATRRSWDSLICLHASLRALGREEELDVFARGSIGPTKTPGYTAFVRLVDLPDPEALIVDPSSYHPDPKRPDRDYTVALAVAAAATRGIKAEANVDKKLMDRYVGGWKVLGRIAERDKALVTCAVKDYMVEFRPRGGLSHPEVKPISDTLRAVTRLAGAAV